nr:hypothetical protein [Tanacetum cinerariifolium]
MEENLHVRFSENTSNNIGSGPNWLFDIDALTKTMNYQPVSNDFSCTQASNDAGTGKEPHREYILLPLWTADSPFSTTSKSSQDNEFQPSNDGPKRVDENLSKENGYNAKGQVNGVGTNISIDLPPDPNMPSLKDIGIFKDSDDDEDAFLAEADFYNLDSTFQVSPIPTTRIHKDHPLEHVIRDLHLALQTRRMSKNLEEHGLDKYVAKILKKYGFSEFKTTSTYMETQKPLLKDEDGEEVDCKKQTVVANSITEVEYVVASSCYGQFWTTTKSKTVNGEVQIHALVDGMKVIVIESSIKRDLQLADEDGFIQTFLDKQLDGLPNHKEKYDISFHTKKVFVHMKRIGKEFSGDGPRRQDTMGIPMLILGMRDYLKCPVIYCSQELTHLETKIDGLEKRVKKLEKKQGSRNHKLKILYKVGLTVKVISSFDDEALDKEDTSKQGRIIEIDADEDIALVSIHDDELQDEGIKDVGEEEVVEVVTTAKMLIDTVVDAAQVTTAIADIPVSATETIVTIAPTITAESTKTNVEEKGKGNAKLIKEPKMPKKRKHQISADKELAEKLQARMQDEIDEEVARERAQKEQEANDALINTWDNIQAKINVDSQLAHRLHEEEQLQFTDAEKAKLFMEFIEKRRKFFAAKRDTEKRNKPPTNAQQRNIMDE